MRGNLSYGALWTEEEMAILRRHYPELGGRGIAHLLPGRSYGAIQLRASQFKIRHRFYWTKELDERLELLWDRLDTREISKLLGRSERGVFERGRQMGLALGIPSGHESLDAAAHRTGFNRNQLSAILIAAKVPITIPKCKPLGKKWRRLCVDTFRVDRAVAEWLDTETVHGAALRRGVRPHTLRVMLKRANVRNPGKYQTWRLPSSVIDRVLAEVAA